MTAMMRLLRFLETQTRVTLFVIGIALMLAIALGDLITGSELSFSIFYLIPIASLPGVPVKNGG